MKFILFIRWANGRISKRRAPSADQAFIMKNRLIEIHGAVMNWQISTAGKIIKRGWQ